MQQGYQQQPMQQEPPMDVMATNYPAFMDKAHAELIMAIIDPADIVEEVKNKLMGKALKTIYDKKTETYKSQWVQVTEPCINQRGLNEITAMLNMMLGRSSALSYITDKEAEKLATDFANELNDIIYLRQKSYAIKKSYMKFLTLTIFQTVYMHLKKSVNGRYLEFLKGTTRYIEQYTDGSSGGRGKKGLKDMVNLFK